MGACISPPPALRLSQVEGGLCVTVPYDSAQQWQRYFRAHGIGSTLIRDPWTREASLDLWQEDFRLVPALPPG